MAGAGPPHTVKRPEIVMKRTHHHLPGPIPAPHANHSACPECGQPVTSAHTCKPKAANR